MDCYRCSSSSISSSSNHYGYHSHLNSRNKLKPISLTLQDITSLSPLSSLSLQDISSLTMLSLVPIPVEISSLDTITTTATTSVPTIPITIPNTDIETLDGGDNLGTLLWSFVLYNGIFTSGKPADWYLPIVGKVLNTDNEQWYKDYIDGYEFDVPVIVEAVRAATFLALGFYINLAIITIFDNDTFWGWSIGMCLAIPSALLNASRDKLITRKLGQLQEKCIKDFNDFASSRLMKSDSKSATVSETALINAFRRTYVAYRYAVSIDSDGDSSFDNIDNNNSIDDKFLRKVIRNYIGYKPNEGVYKYVTLLNTKKDALDENKKLVAKANAMRKEFLRSSLTTNDASVDNNTNTVSTNTIDNAIDNNTNE